MHVRRTLHSAVCLLVATASATAWAQAGSLTDDVRRLVAAQKLGAAKVGICIRDVENGLTLADLNGSTPLTPASNMKLLTSGAALLVLSPDYQFSTELVQDGDRLILRGSGDPALADPEVLSLMKPKMTVGDVLDVIADAATTAGVRNARELVVDDRVFDREFVHPSWPADKLDRGYSCQVSGLNFHANVILVFPRPGGDGPGSPPSFAIEPESPFLSISNKARTIANGKNSVWLSREPDTNRFTLHGDVKYAAQVGVEITIHDPAMFAGQLLADRLKGVGAMTSPTVRLAGPADPGGPTGKSVAAITTPISEVMKRCNTDSANLYAESLLKSMGHAVTKEPGSWKNGASVLRMVLSQKLGPDQAARVTIADGSGLSRDNAVSAEALARWLEVMGRDRTVRDMFAESLASPGEGTLRERFRGDKIGTHICAKSGFINGVRTLSGYAIDEASGRRVAFSVMVNDIKTDTQTLASKELHEQIALLCDRWLAARASQTPKLGG
ncbi:MAG: D-alanyl-D-alanine carboxypeptidase/D-alanyl-D-alanine-endopeptidase [Phycisphaerales bacterium]|nr:D-alanyl-D-alanine carboxypeptidase/D-alanyl-D-alanine-endopeptidase [Phycisphaerales bacterium]